MIKNSFSLLSWSESLLPKEERSGRIEILLSVSLFFTLSLGWFYFFEKGLFIFQENNILFVFSSDYLEKFTDKPGGLLTYAGNFISQFYFNPFAGSLIISVMLALAFIQFRKIVVLLAPAGQFTTLFVLLPSCMLLLVSSHYDFHAHDLLGFLITFSWFILSADQKNKTVHFITIFLFPVLYYFTGSYSLVYAGLYIVYSLIYTKGSQRYISSVSLAAMVIITYFVFSHFLFYQPAARLLRYPLFVTESSGLTIVLSVFICLLIMYPVLARLSAWYHAEGLTRRIIPFVSIISVFSLTVFLLFRNYDPAVSNVMKFEQMVYDHNWDGVIMDYEKMKSSSIVEQYYYNLSLAEKGELCNRLFYGRQSFGSMSLTLMRDDEQSYRALYFYYAVGLTAEAHHLAYEQVVQHGYHPENIKMLIKTELINGNFRVARRYINVLKKTLHYTEWATKYERMLDRPEAVKSDPELGEKIRLQPVHDFFVVTDDFSNIEMLLRENPGNTIAFEYKMARLLLEKDLMEVGKEVNKLKSLGYAHFPRHIEEAIVSLVNATREFPDLGGLKISKETDQRFLQYFSDLKSFRGDKKQVETGIKKTDKNTFWFYLQYGLIRNDFTRRGQTDNSIY